MSKRHALPSLFALLLVTSPLLLTGCCAPPMVGLETRRIDLPTTGAEPAAVRALAAEVTAGAAVLDLRDLLARARAEVAADGRPGAADLGDVDADQVDIGIDPEPLTVDTLPSYSRSTFGPGAGLGLDPDRLSAELGDHDLLLRVRVEISPWPEQEGFTYHPELLCARAQVLWISTLHGTPVDLSLAQAVADLGVDWIAERLLGAAAQRGIDCRRDDPPGPAGG